MDEPEMEPIYNKKSKKGRSPKVRKTQRKAGAIVSKILYDDILTVRSLFTNLTYEDMRMFKKIEKIFNGENTRLKRRIVKKIANINPTVAIPFLVDALDSEHEEIREEAAVSIQKIANRAYKEEDAKTIALLFPVASKLLDVVAEMKKDNKSTLELDKALDAIIYGDS